MIEGLRPFQWEDLEKMVPLLETCEVEDKNGKVPTVENLRHQLTIPGLEAERYIHILPDADGSLIAFCVSAPVPGPSAYSIYVSVYVRPDHRAGGLQDALLDFVEQWSAEWHAQTGQPAVLNTSTKAHQENFRQLYERHSFQAVRWFLKLERDLTQPIAAVPEPAGIQIRAMHGPADVEDIHFTLHDSFRDHWNPPDFTQEQTAHLIASPGFRPELLLLAYSESGEPAGVCVNRILEESNRQQNVQEGLVDMLGVRRPFRRMGLARALLTRSLNLLKQAGMTTAILGVDAENPTGAMGLYTSVGFKERERSIHYQKPVSAGKGKGKRE